MKIALKWGLLLGLALIIGTQILTWVGLGTSIWFVIMTNVFLLAFIYIALSASYQSNDQKLTFLNALISVLVVVVVSRYLFQFYLFMYTTYIDPMWVDNTAAIWTEKMIDDGATGDKIEKTIEAFKRSYEPLRMFTTEIFTVGIPQIIMGLLVALYFVVKGKKK